VGLGSAYLAYGKTAESADSFSKALTVNSNSAIAYNGLAYLYSFQKDAKKTEDALKKSVSIKKDYFDSQAFLANLYLSQKRHAEAAKEYENALEIDKTLVAPLNGLGWAYYYSGRFTDAGKSFEESRKLNPYLAEAHYGLGLTCSKLGDKETSKAEFVTAIQIWPYYSHTKDLVDIIKADKSLSDLYMTLGWSYYYNLQYAAALDAFKEFLKDKPGDLSALRGIAWSNYWVGQLDTAYSNFQEILKSDAADRDALLGLGTISYVLGDFKASVETFGKLVEGLPKTSESWDKWSYMQDNLGWSYYYSKEYNKALETFRRLEGYHPKIKYIAPVNGQAWCLLQTGNKSEAEKLFRESLKIVPGNYSAETGIKSLKE
jgi:tetratricopeptide (TPR) repeat protein